MGVEARIECGWIPSLQHGNGVFDGIDVVLDSQKHFEGVFRGVQERHDLLWATTLRRERQYLFQNEGNGGRALLSPLPARFTRWLMDVRRCQLCVNALRYTPKGL